MALLVAAGVLIVAIALRIVVAGATRAVLSVDSWFWRAYVETSRRDGRFPPQLPRYLFDEEQWYPPLFPWLLVRLPALQHVYVHLGLALDVIRLVLLVSSAAWLGGGDVAVVLAAGLAYATTPVLVNYNVQPNPRALAALFLDGLALLLLVGRTAPGEVAWTWGAIGVLAGLVLLTHKMTTQLLWFAALAAALSTREWGLVVLVPLSLAAAWLLSGGFYSKVLQAHADIVAFWNRNWRWLNADPIRESPVYGDRDFRTPGLVHQPGLKGLLRHGVGLFRLAPSAWIALAVAAATVMGGARSGQRAAVALWLFLTLAFAVVTTWVQPLKCLGAGSLYLYNAAFPAALALGLGAASAGLGRTAAAIAVIVNLGALGVFLWRHRSAPVRDDAGWEALVVHLEAAERGPVLCLPQNLYDELAYRTGQPVLFGGHGYGFRRLEPLFPRLQLSFAAIRERYGLRYLVAREGTLNDRAAADLPPASATFGRYRLYEWR